MTASRPLPSLLLRRVRLLDCPDLVDVLVAEGYVAAVGPGLEGLQTVDLNGGLLIPAFVDAHLHVNRAFTWRPGLRPATLREAAAQWRLIRTRHTGSDVLDRGRRLLDQIVRFGTTAVRAHTDVDRTVGLTVLEPLVALRDEYAGRMTVQVVAFPPAGASPYDLSERRLLEAAVAAGADLIGGAPNFDPDPRRYIDALIELGRATGCRLDVHIDEGHPARGVWTGYLAERAEAAGLVGRVTASHCCALGAMPEREARRVIAAMRAAGMSVVACPPTNLYLQDEWVGAADPPWRGTTRIRSLRASGIPVALGSDNIQDLFFPYGQGNMVEVAFLAALAGQYGRHEQADVLSMATTEGAQVLGLSGWKIEIGAPANLVAFPPVENLLAARPAPRLVLSGGEVVWHDV